MGTSNGCGSLDDVGPLISKGIHDSLKIIEL